MSGNAHFRALSELVAQVTNSLPAHLLVPMARYLVAKGVLPGSAEPAVATSPGSARELHASLLEFLRSQQAPAILKYVVLGTLDDAADGTDDPSAHEALFVPPTPDFSGVVRELKKDREFQVASLAPLDRHDSAHLFDHVIALLENPRSPRPRPMLDRPTWVPNDQHPWPHTGQVAWAEVLARVESDEIREEFREVIAQHRATGHPGDVAILDALLSREQTERVRASLAKVLELPTRTARDRCQRWAALVDWGQRQLARIAPGSTIDLKDEVHAHALYGTPESPLSIPLLWAAEAKGATVALHPLAVNAGFVAADLSPLHALGRDLDRILDGEAVDIRPTAEKVRLIVAEIEIRAERPHGDADESDGTAASDRPAAAPTETLKFPRPLTAAQACLDALTNAPRGIPNYEELAKATGYAVPTIKEAMPPLAKAEHVEKRDGAWHITDKGREHLKALRSG